MKKLFLSVLFCSIFLLLNAQSINRKALVERHIVVLNKVDTLGSLSVGNGRFAYTCDITGMQSFPDAYSKGVPLGTQADWGWHSFPNVENLQRDKALKSFPLDGREVSYLVQGKDATAKPAVEYFRVNPHRLQLGQIGLLLFRKNGRSATIEDLKNISQTLNPWTGIISSTFTLEEDTVRVETMAHQEQDVLGFRIHSSLFSKGRLKLVLRFPYPNGQFKDVGNHFVDDDRHSSVLSKNGNAWMIRRQLDTSVYHVGVQSDMNVKLETDGLHRFVLTSSTTKLDVNISFGKTFVVPGGIAQIQASSVKGWKKFWLSGAVVDFSGSTDKRAFELERRVVLSQYLTKLQCTSNNPPQETGLTYNSWYGKPHIEMHWWHGVHFAQWGRGELLERSMDWYFRTQQVAGEIANRQGYKGIRWQKMTDNDGAETPSSVGAFLIWQQPHFIFIAEQLYQQDPSIARLEKYKDLIFETASFMADFVQYDTNRNVYNLGKGLIPAQECFDAMVTYNPTYELAYWSWGLQKAQEWRLRAGLKRHPEWDEVIRKIAPLPVKDGVYLASESTPDCYTNPRYLSDHPAVLGAFGMLPKVHDLDTAIMARTFTIVKERWNWDDTWGWDYPMMAMTAARLGKGNDAVDALLMPVRTNTYLVNGHNYQDGRLTIYLPGNGGLLSAVALMCTGNAPGERNAGFPKNGTWKVKCEGFRLFF